MILIIIIIILWNLVYFNSADYQLGGGVVLGVVYFDVEETANSVDRTDVTGIATKLHIGF